MKYKLIFLIILISLSLFTINSLAQEPKITGTWTGYKADDFFVKLIENKADITDGYAIFEISNPTSFDIVLNKSVVGANTANAKGNALQNMRFFLLENKTKIDTVGLPINCKNVTTNETEEIVSGHYGGFNITVVNKTKTVCDIKYEDKISYYEDFTELKEITLKPHETARIKITGSWGAKLGRNLNEWIPKITLDKTEISQTKWAWWDASWTKCKNITIDNSAGFYALTNYSILVNVTYDSDMQGDFDDVRFVGASCNNGGLAYNYTFENYTDSGYANMWFRVDDSISVGTFIASMYYGNAGVGNASNYETAFLDADNCNGATLDADWTTNVSTGGNVLVGGGYCNVSTGNTGITEFAWMKRGIAASRPYIFEAYAATNISGGAAFPGHFGTTNNQPLQNHSAWNLKDIDEVYQVNRLNTVDTYTGPTAGYTLTSFAIFATQHPNTSTKVSFLYNNTNKTALGGYDINAQKIYAGDAFPDNSPSPDTRLIIDWVRIRVLSDNTTPTYTFGSEESATVSSNEVTLSVPTDNSWNNTYVQTFTYTPTFVQEILNCSLWTNVTGSWALTASNASAVTNASANSIYKTFTSDANISWNIGCYNSTGIINASANRTVFLDATKPTITIVYPTNTTYTGMSLWANATANERSINSCDRNLDGGTNTSMTNSTGNWNNLMSFASSASHNLTVYCNDSAGNSNKSLTTYFTNNLPAICTDWINVTVDQNDVTCGADGWEFTPEANQWTAVNYTATTNLSEGGTWLFNFSSTGWSGEVDAFFAIKSLNETTGINTGEPTYSRLWFAFVDGGLALAYHNTTIEAGVNNWELTYPENTWICADFPCWNGQYFPYTLGSWIEWNVTISNNLVYNRLSNNTDIIVDAPAIPITNISNSTINLYMWVGDVLENWGSGEMKFYSFSYTAPEAEDYPLNLYFNGTANANKTYTYPNASNATGTVTAGETGYLYRDNVLKSTATTPNETILLGNGTYAYKLNSTNNATGLTYYVIVNKGTPSIHLALNGTENNVTYACGQTINATGWVSTPSDGIGNLYRNGTQISPLYQENANSTSTNGVWTGAYPAINTYDENWDTMGYADCTNPSGANLYVNYTKPQNKNGQVIWNVKGGDSGNPIQNLTVLSSCVNYDSNVIMFKVYSDCYGSGVVTWNCYNGSWVSLYSPPTNAYIYEESIFWYVSDINQLSGGVYNYSFNYSGNANYSASEVWYLATVEQQNASVNIYLNGTQYNWSSYYPNSTINITAVANVTGAPVAIYRNTSTELCTGTTSCSYIAKFGVAGYNFTANITDPTNYTADLDTLYATITKGVAGLTLYLNGSSYNQSSMYENSTVNFTAVSNISEAYVQIWRNATLMANTTGSSSGITKVGAGYWNFSAKEVDTTNFSSSLSSLFWNVSKGDSNTTIYLNGSYHNLSISYTDIVNITAFTNITIGSGLVKLSLNDTDYGTNYTSGALSIINITNTSNMAIAVFRINATYDGDANASSSTATSVYLTVKNISISLERPSGTSTWKLNTSSCFPTSGCYQTGNFTPLNQSNTSTGWFYRINNTGAEITNITLKKNTTFTSCIRYYITNVSSNLFNNNTNFVNESSSTTPVTIYTNLAVGGSATFWTWVVFNSCTPGTSVHFNDIFSGALS